jgi:hypothetical protein
VKMKIQKILPVLADSGCINKFLSMFLIIHKSRILHVYEFRYFNEKFSEFANFN